LTLQDVVGSQLSDKLDGMFDTECQRRASSDEAIKAALAEIISQNAKTA